MVGGIGKNILSLMARLGAFLLDLSFAYLMARILSNYLPIRFDLLVLSFFFLWRLYSTLLAGQTLFQRVLGLKATRGFFWKRFGGAIRVFLELPLLPFALFDLLYIVLGKRSIKERLSQAPLIHSGHPAISIIAFIIALILSVSLFLFTPLINDLSNSLTKHDTVPMNLTKSMSGAENFSNYRDYKSVFYNLAFFSTLSDQRFALVPWREKKEGGDDFYILFYDKQEHLSISFTKIALPALQLVERATTRNPWLYKTFPALLTKTYNSDWEKSYQRLLVNAFELSFFNPSSFVTYGPFTHSLVELRQFILDQLPKESGEWRLFEVSLLRKRYLALIRGDTMLWYPENTPQEAWLFKVSGDSSNINEALFTLVREIFTSLKTGSISHDARYPSDVDAFVLVDHLKNPFLSDKLYKDGLSLLFARLNDELKKDFNGSQLVKRSEEAFLKE